MSFCAHLCLIDEIISRISQNDFHILHNGHICQTCKIIRVNIELTILSCLLQIVPISSVNRMVWCCCSRRSAIPTCGGALQRSMELQTVITVAGGVASDHRGAGEDPGLTACCRTPCPAGRAVGWLLSAPASLGSDGHDLRNAPLLSLLTKLTLIMQLIHIHP